MATATRTSATPPEEETAASRTYEIAEDFTLSGLQERLRTFVAHESSLPGLVLAVAGGGGHLLSSLAATPGASKVLLQASILYDRESYRRYIQKHVDTHDVLRLEESSFRYASTQAAGYAATASLQEALAISAAANATYGHEALHNIRRAVGVGIASALKSPQKLATSKTSRAFITAEVSTGQVWSMAVQLAKSDRTRVEEDIAVAHCALTLLECVQSETSPIPRGVRQATMAGDQWEIQCLQPDYADAQELNRASIREGVARILERGEESVMLLPDPTSGTGVAFRCIRRTVLPPQSIIFPGSFNPVHDGHVELAEAAMAQTSSKMAFFELSITNADKPALSLEAIQERLDNFLQMPLLNKAGEASILSDCRWGILLTNAPLFKQKVDILQPLHVSRTDNQPAPLPFVIGTDTLVRLVDPKYYNDSYEEMVVTLEGMACDFVVGGRLEQKKNGSSVADFVSGETEVNKLPDSIRSKFTALSDFRFDISSSEIRRQLSGEVE
jgi:nicotinic acid mononucleotide adenylyltransferase